MLSFLSLFHLHFMVICPRFLINTVCKLGGRTRYYSYVRLCLLSLITKICNSKKHSVFPCTCILATIRNTTQMNFIFWLSVLLHFVPQYNFVFYITFLTKKTILYDLWTDAFSLFLFLTLIQFEAGRGL